jgi:hypothetical protein
VTNGDAMRCAALRSIEEVDAQLRAMMPWIGENRLVDPCPDRDAAPPTACRSKTKDERTGYTDV